MKNELSSKPVVMSTISSNEANEEYLDPSNFKSYVHSNSEIVKIQSKDKATFKKSAEQMKSVIAEFEAVDEESG